MPQHIEDKFLIIFHVGNEQGAGVSAKILFTLCKNFSFSNCFNAPGYFSSSKKATNERDNRLRHSS